jgi:hypothetical protein
MVSKVFEYVKTRVSKFRRDSTFFSRKQVHRGTFKNLKNLEYKTSRLPNILANGHYIFLATKTPGFKEP